MKLNYKIFILLVIFCITQTSCSRAIIRKNLGVKQDAPDEFMVEPKTKLIIPDEIPSDLPIPQAREKRELAKYNPEETIKTLFGERETPLKTSKKSSLEKQILANANANKSKQNIRKLIEEDYKNKSSVLGTEPGGIMESIIDPFGYNRAKPEIIDGEKENARIKKAIARGQM